MKAYKRIAVLGLSTVLMASSLTGCYKKVDTEDYATTVVATFADQKVYLNEVNYYLKTLQASYDSYYEYFYKPYYGFSNKKEFYDSTAFSDGGKTVWASLKEDAMACVSQTYILNFHAKELGVELSDEDKKKIDEAVKEFLEKTDPGVIEACAVDEKSLTDIYTRNAYANKVWEKMVADIDTKVNEADFRYTNVAYLAITEKASTSSNNADKNEKIDVEKKADEVLTELKKQMEIYKESGKKDDSIPYNATIKEFEKDNIKIVYTASKEFSKPEVKEGDNNKTETLQSICWNNLKKGEYTTWYDSKNKTSYVIYCTDDDVIKSKEAAITSELNNRKSKMFTEKYPDMVKNSPSFDINKRVYGQIKYKEIKYKKTGADTSGNDVSDNNKK